jgi:hypothetical protein
MPIRYLIAWVPMIFIAIGNAALRESLFAPRMAELHSHQLSTATAILFFAIYIGFMMRWLKPGSSRQTLAIGLFWLVLTVSFEFLFGRFVMGHPWSKLLSDYNLSAGRVWPLLLLWITIAPYLFYRWQSKR